MSKLAEYRPNAFAFPDSLNLFEGQRELTSTAHNDFIGHGKMKIVRASPNDCISFSSDKVEDRTTLQDAYRPYSGKNYLPAGGVKAPVDGVKLIKTTKAVNIPARPRTQMKNSDRKLEGITSYSYQYTGETSENSEPFRPKSELEGPHGDRSFNSTSGDYSKFNYGRPTINRIPDTGLFDKCSYADGTTMAQHFASPSPTKEPNLRPKTSVLLGSEKFVPRSSYRKQFDTIKQVFGS